MALTGAFGACLIFAPAAAVGLDGLSGVFVRGLDWDLAGVFKGAFAGVFFGATREGFFGAGFFKLDTLEAVLTVFVGVFTAGLEAFVTVRFFAVLLLSGVFLFLDALDAAALAAFPGEDLVFLAPDTFDAGLAGLDLGINVRTPAPKRTSSEKKRRRNYWFVCSAARPNRRSLHFSLRMSEPFKGHG